MTDGREALAEAARLESARVYGRLQREHRPDCAQPVHEAQQNDPQPVHDTKNRESPAKTVDSERVAELRRHYFDREAG